MKLRFSRHAALALAASLIATSAAHARKTKIDSVVTLAHLLVTRLPQGSNETVYVALPIWKGKGNHYPLCQKIGEEFDEALSAAEPADKVVTPAEAAAILSKLGVQPLDVYVRIGYVARLISAPLLITTDIRPKGHGLALTVEAKATDGKKRYAKLEALLPSSPQLLSLLSQPDAPIKDSTGIYLAGVGGVGEPRCEHCPNPPFPTQAAKAGASGAVLVGFTVGLDGKTSHLELLKNSTVPGAGQAALEAIRSWMLRPAQGPDGKPVPVRLIAEIRFSLLR